jgi:hypothetical protein
MHCAAKSSRVGFSSAGKMLNSSPNCCGEPSRPKWGVGLSHERSDIAGAESLYSLEGNMCGTVLRGAVALPGSKATSRAKGSYRNLGDLISDPLAICLNGPCREGEEPTPAMYGGEKSDRAIVAGKLTNKSGAICCGVGGAKGRDQGECAPATHAPDSAPQSVSQMLARIRQHSVVKPPPVSGLLI